MKTIILDPGHGGLIEGRYQTFGKRSPEYDGLTLYEGEFNRAIVHRIEEMCYFAGIPYYNVSEENRDISLRLRVARANGVYYKNSLYLSVHANAGQGHGWEVWTSPGQTKADQFAMIMAEEFTRSYPGVRLRADTTDGDIDKEARFRVLTETKMPAILTENFFMDNPDECRKYLMSRKHRDRIAEFHFRAIKRAVIEIK